MVKCYSGKKVYIVGNGVCTKRSLDARRIGRYFQLNQCDIVVDPMDADFIFIVTCAFIESYIDTAIKTINDHTKFRKEVVVFGCLPKMAPERFKKIHDGKSLDTKDLMEIDKIFPDFQYPFSETRDEFYLFNSVYEGRIEDKSYTNKDIDPFNINKDDSPMLRICYGCSGHCTYCIHPPALGPLRSKSIRECIDDYQTILKKHDPKHIKIHGNDPGGYGIDINHTYPELLQALVDVDENHPCRWKLSDIHPKWIVKYESELLKIFQTGKVTHIGVPIQSGSNKVLKKMNRGYPIGKVIRSLRRFIMKHPSISISTHIIIGFPGETEKDFYNTLSLFEKIQFQTVFVFRYSAVNGSKAASFPDHISEFVIDQRMNRAIEHLKRKAKRLNVFDKMSQAVPHEELINGHAA